MKTVSELILAAKARVQNLTPADVRKEMERGDVILVDLREPGEQVENGVIPGAISAPRGLLEFYADPTSKYHKPELVPERRIILHCAVGGRSALAADTLQQMGYANVAHMEGGFQAWKEQGHPVARDRAWVTTRVEP